MNKSDHHKTAMYKWAVKWLYAHNSNDYYAKELAEEVKSKEAAAIRKAVAAALEEAAHNIEGPCELTGYQYARRIRAIDPEVVVQRAGEGSKTERSF